MGLRARGLSLWGAVPSRAGRSLFIKMILFLTCWAQHYSRGPVLLAPAVYPHCPREVLCTAETFLRAMHGDPAFSLHLPLSHTFSEERFPVGGQGLFSLSALILRQTMLRADSCRPHSSCILVDEICSWCTMSSSRLADHTLPSLRLVNSWATPTPPTRCQGAVCTGAKAMVNCATSSHAGLDER